MTLKYSTLLSFLVGVCALVPTTLFSQDAPSLLATAYDRIESQVNDKTFLVVRIDLTAIDSQTFAKTLDDVYVRFMKERGFSAAKIKTGRREFNVATDAISEAVEAFEQMRAALNVREIFIVVQDQSDKSARIVIPGSQKEIEAQAAQMTTLLFESSLKPIKIAKGCAFATDAEEDAAIYKNFKPGVNAPLKRFYQNEASGTVQVFCSRLNLETFYKNAHEFLVKIGGASENSYEEFKTGADSFKSYFQQLDVSIDINRLAIKGSIGFTTPERAEDARGSLEALGDKIIDALYDDGGTFFGVPDSISKEYNLAALSREVERASLKAALPKRSGASLRFEFTPDSENFWSNTFAIALMVSP